MSRSGYTDDYDEQFPNACALYWRAVENAINGKRGQEFLKELLRALDAKLEKTLVAHALVTEDGNHCALGVIGHMRGINMPVGIAGEDYEEDDDSNTRWMAAKLKIAPALAKEIVYLNDEGSYRDDTDEKRFQRVRDWVSRAIRTSGSAP